MGIIKAERVWSIRSCKNLHFTVFWKLDLWGEEITGSLHLICLSGIKTKITANKLKWFWFTAEYKHFRISLGCILAPNDRTSFQLNYSNSSSFWGKVCSVKLLFISWYLQIQFQFSSCLFSDRSVFLYIASIYIFQST